MFPCLHTRGYLLAKSIGLRSGKPYKFWCGFLQVRGTTVKTSKGNVWKMEAPPFRQFRGTCSSTHFKIAVPKDPSRIDELKVKHASRSTGQFEKGKNEPNFNATTYTVAKFMSTVLCMARKAGEGEEEQSCVRIAYFEKAKGWPLDPRYVGAAYVYIDEQGSSVFDEDQHRANCTCEKKQGPQPPLWSREESGVTQVLNLQQSSDHECCFLPLREKDYAD